MSDYSLAIQTYRGVVLLYSIGLHSIRFEHYLWFYRGFQRTQRVVGEELQGEKTMCCIQTQKEI